MKKALGLTCALVAVIAGRAQTNTTITAEIKDLPAGQWVYFYPLMDGQHKDSVQTVAGGFTLRTNVPQGDGYMLRIGAQYAQNNSAMMFIEPGTVKIKGPGPMFKDAKYTGQDALAQAADYKGLIDADPVLKGRSDLYKKANELYAKHDSTGLAALEPELNKVDSIDNLRTKEWIAKHKSSSYSAFLLSFNLGRIELNEKDSILSTLTAGAKNNGPAKRIMESVRIQRLTGIGQMAPEFTQSDTSGKAVSLKDFRGKYVLIDFWASWCKPCRAENPNVVAAWKQYHDKNFTVLGVSLDQPNGKERWLKAIHDDGLTWTHVSDLKFWSNAVAKQYDINSIPANLLIDPSGKIIAKDLHEGELAKKLSELLN